MTAITESILIMLMCCVSTCLSTSYKILFLNTGDYNDNKYTRDTLLTEEGETRSTVFETWGTRHRMKKQQTLQNKMIG